MPTPKAGKYRRWNENEVIQELRMIPKLSPGYVRDHFPGLYGAAIRLFGGWKAAVRAAGIDYDKILSRKEHGFWTKERVIEAIQQLPEKHSSVVRRKDLSLYSAAIRLFGSWDGALKESGLNYDSIRLAYRLKQKTAKQG